MRVGVFHVGTQHSWQTALAFQEAGQLAWYATSVFYKPTEWPYCLERLPVSPFAVRLHREFKRRFTPDLDPDKVRLAGPYEWPRTLARRLGMPLVEEWLNLINIRTMTLRVNRLMADEPVDVVWGYNTMSEGVFVECRRRGIPCVLDQTIGHPAEMNRLFEHESSVHADYFRHRHRPFSASWIARQNRECALADRVVVGSNLCGQTLVKHGCDEAKIELLHYGYDERKFSGVGVRKVPADGRQIRFLYVGSVEPRKGSHHLIEAFRHIAPERAHLTMVGRQVIPSEKLRKAPKNITFIPQAPRDEVAKYFLSADCFIMPSLFEGSAVVLCEALGAGLGIIQTAAAGFGVQHGRNGILLEQPSPQAIASAVNYVLDAPERISVWSRESLDLSRHSRWTDYRGKCRLLAESLHHRDKDACAIRR